MNETVAHYDDAKLQEITEKVKNVIVDQLGVEYSSIRNDSSFVDDLGADSLDLVELIMLLEEEFNTPIRDDDAEKIKTIGEVVRFIAMKTSKAN